MVALQHSDKEHATLRDCWVGYAEIGNDGNYFSSGADPSLSAFSTFKSQRTSILLMFWIFFNITVVY